MSYEIPTEIAYHAKFSQPIDVSKHEILDLIGADKFEINQPNKIKVDNTSKKPLEQRF
jgi:hypothetical protein